MINAAFFGIGALTIYLVLIIGYANHSRTFQSEDEKTICLLTLWAVPVAISVTAALAGILFKRFIPNAPWPILQTIFLAVVPIVLFTPFGEHLTSWKHAGDLAIFIIYALATSSLASCVRNAVIGISEKRIVKGVANAIVGLGSAFVVFAGTWFFLFFE